jgi:uncharacterized protein (TIGR02271 family)
MRGAFPVIDQKHVAELMGRTVYDQQGEKVGKVAQVYLDGTTDQPTWVTVQTGLFGTKESFVPLHRAEMSGGDLRVAVAKETVKEAPRIDADGELPPREEAELYRHYGLARGSGQRAGSSGRDAKTGMPTGAPTGDRGRDRAGDEAMTRSEERLSVGVQQTESGRVRLRKYVVTEQAQATVPVSHEEVRLEREPITDANRDQAMRGAPISEAEHEVVLHEQRPVVNKETVPVERVRLGKEQVTEDRTVGGEVRKEQIDVDRADATDADRRRRG